MSVRIVLPDPGSKVRSGAGTRCLMSSGEELQGVASIDVRIRVDEIITATVELCSIRLDEIEAELELVMQHPISGSLVRVKSISFQDGSEWCAQ